MNRQHDSELRRLTTLVAAQKLLIELQEQRINQLERMHNPAMQLISGRKDGDLNFQKETT